MFVETIIYVKFRLKLYQTMRKCQGWHNARFCCFSWLDFRPPNQKKLDYDQILRGNMLDTVQISGGMYDRLSLPRKRSDVLNWGRPPPKTENRALMQQCRLDISINLGQCSACTQLTHLHRLLRSWLQNNAMPPPGSRRPPSLPSCSAPTT